LISTIFYTRERKRIGTPKQGYLAFELDANDANSNALWH